MIQRHLGAKVWCQCVVSYGVVGCCAYVIYRGVYGYFFFFYSLPPLAAFFFPAVGLGVGL